MRPRRDIRDAVVVITGASSGIGKATALAFAGLGARLVLAGAPRRRWARSSGPAKPGAPRRWWCRPTSPTPRPSSGWPAGR
jgi:short chain dehydrogenase